MRYLWCGSLLVAATLAVQIDLAGKQGAQSAAWTQPFPPFAITRNLYYVGSKGLASYLVTTSQGHVLINSNLQESVPLIRASVEKLGFKFSDIKVLLISHAHWDHNAGSAAVKAATGARYMVMDADVAAVESGGKADFQYGNDPATHYPATKVDRVLKDGDEVRLGDAVLVGTSPPRAHERLHHVDDQSAGRGPLLRCCDHRQSERERRISAPEQREVPTDCG